MQHFLINQMSRGIEPLYKSGALLIWNHSLWEHIFWVWLPADNTSSNCFWPRRSIKTRRAVCPAAPPVSQPLNGAGLCLSACFPLPPGLCMFYQAWDLLRARTITQRHSRRHHGCQHSAVTNAESGRSPVLSEHGVNTAFWVWCIYSRYGPLTSSASHILNQACISRFLSGLWELYLPSVWCLHLIAFIIVA